MEELLELIKAKLEEKKAEEARKKSEKEEMLRPLMGVPLPPPAEAPADKANQ